MRFAAPLAFAVTLAAGAALAQAPAPVHTATINGIKVSGAVATSASNTGVGAGAGSGDTVTNLLSDFSSAQPAMPVLTPPAAPKAGSKDCGGSAC